MIDGVGFPLEKQSSVSFQGSTAAKAATGIFWLCKKVCRSSDEGHY